MVRGGFGHGFLLRVQNLEPWVVQEDVDGMHFMFETFGDVLLLLRLQ